MAAGLWLCSVLVIVVVGSSLSEPANIDTVHFVSTCHLDVGFADTAANVVNRYFDHYFHDSIATSQALRSRGGEEQLVFLTHSYLVYLYLDCPPNMGLHCPSKDNITMFIDAVNRGDISWHAMPFNSQLEIIDADFMDFHVKMSHMLDARFKKSPKLTMSQRDVPGTTRSIIPTLVSNGVEALSVGVNPSSMPPAVPPIFKWLHKPTNQSVIAMWHAKGYGGMSGVTADSTVTVPGSSHALAFRFRVDNSGPPAMKEVLDDFAAIRKLFPGAKIVASDFDSFVRAILPMKDTLPVYTEEIGDTWIYGVPSDPVKMQQVREIMRARSECVENNICNVSDYRFFNFSRLLTKGPEHTWGKALSGYLKDYKMNWHNKEFHSLIHTPEYVGMTNSWLEQRLWAIDYAIEALADHPLRKEINERLAALKPSGPALDGYVKVDNIGQVFKTGPLEVAFSPQTGAIVHFSNTAHGTSFASADYPWGQLVYQTFDTEDFTKFIDEYRMYINPTPGWMPGDFGKPGLNDTLHQTVSPVVNELWHKTSDTGASFALKMSFPESLVTDYGAPASVWSVVDVLQTEARLEMDISLFNKTATRLPESLSVYFRPHVKNPENMRLTKIGQLLNPSDVMKNGSQHLHAVDTQDGVLYMDPFIRFNSMDTSVVCVGRPTPFPTPVSKPNVDDGFAFNIVNNIWGTNYLMWFPLVPDDASTKYRINVLLPECVGQNCQEL
ncbi:uncharacterized protein [Oscarella lobularis]|uniref:uncharacterized protein isoform X2 n=1 Tax=Oscarella lobularis TaxID=121494 RepID=UPI003313AF66